MQLFSDTDTIWVHSTEGDLLTPQVRESIKKSIKDKGKELIWSEDSLTSFNLYLVYEKGLQELFETDSVLVVGKYYCPVYIKDSVLYSEDSCYK